MKPKNKFRILPYFPLLMLTLCGKKGKSVTPSAVNEGRFFSSNMMEVFLVCFPWGSLLGWFVPLFSLIQNLCVHDHGSIYLALVDNISLI